MKLWDKSASSTALRSNTPVSRPPACAMASMIVWGRSRVNTPFLTTAPSTKNFLLLMATGVMMVCGER